MRQRFLGGDLPLGDDPHVVIDPCGRYLGFIRAADLALRLAAPDTRHSPYANPLTGLPGGVPIGERIDALLHAGNMFVVANCDIEGIGAFNDASGYARGDEVIRFVADVVHRCIEPGTDFLGHIGGDDFIVIFQSADWFERCERMAQLCDLGAPDFYPPEAREGRGFYRYDRLHRRVFVPFFALSIGAVTVEPGRFASYHEIAAAGIEVRERAKLTRGGAIYIDERMYHAAAPGDAAKCYN